MWKVVFTLVLPPSGLAQLSLFYPTANVVGQGFPSATDSLLEQQEATNLALDVKPFRQITEGSTPQGWMQLGTPPKWLKVIFDTGSDKLVAKTWSTVSAELGQMDQGLDGMIAPTNLLYDHNSSSTYSHKMIKDPKTGEVGQMMSQIAYGSGDALTEEGSETIVVGARHLKDFSFSEIDIDSLQMLHTSKGIAGILGLQHMKNKSLGESAFSKMREAGLMTSFGYCRGSNNTGVFIWGDDSKEGSEIPVIGQMHWAVVLNDVKVHDGSASGCGEDVSLLAALGEKKPRAAVKMGRHRQRNRHDHSRGHQQAHGWKKAKQFAGSSDGTFPFDIGGDGGSAGSDEDMGGGTDADAADQGADNGWTKIGGDSMDGGFAGEHESVQRVVQMSKPYMCKDNSCTAILDTGSNIIAGPTKAIKGIIAQINVNNDCSNFDQLPPITFKLGGKPVTIHAESYVMKVPLPTGMSGILGGDGDEDSTGDGDGDDSGFGGDGDESGDGSGFGGGPFQNGDGDFGDDGLGDGDFGGGDGDFGNLNLGAPGGRRSNRGFGAFKSRGAGRVGVAMPHGVQIGIPGQQGRTSITININRQDPQRHAPDNSVRSTLQGQPASLAQQAARQASRHSSATSRWKTALSHLKKHRGIDLITALQEMLRYENGTEAQFLCMPALVPLDKDTAFGPLWIVGTPFLDEYYGRYSFDADADSPKFSFISLNESKTCQNVQHTQSQVNPRNGTMQQHMKEQASSVKQIESKEGQTNSKRRMMRSESSGLDHVSHQDHARQIKKGPRIRTLDEITYPHWAKSLLQI